MDKTIVCSINLFDAEQSLYSVADGEEQKLIAKVPLDHMGKALPEICKEKDIYNVHLFGQKDFAQDIVDAVAKLESNEYSENKINIEVN